MLKESESTLNNLIDFTYGVDSELKSKEVLDIFEDSSIFFRGVLMTDQHHNGEFESKEVLFKQISLEWEERASWIGDFTLSLGTNEAGTRDVPESTSPRDSLSSKHKRATRDNIYTIKAKKDLSKGTSWNWQIDRKKKSAEGSNDDSGFSTTLNIGYITPLFGVKTTSKFGPMDVTAIAIP